MTSARKRLLGFSVCLLLSFLLFTPSLEAKKKSKRPQGPEFVGDVTGHQPYPHRWFEAKGKKGVRVLGQSYRPRPDLAVMELFASPEGKTEIKKVVLKDSKGNVYEGQVRRLPVGFMPTARQNYQGLPADQPSVSPQEIQAVADSSL